MTMDPVASEIIAVLRNVTDHVKVALWTKLDRKFSITYEGEFAALLASAVTNEAFSEIPD